MEITGDNVESYFDNAVEVSKNVILQFKEMGAKTVSVEKIIISDRNGDLIFDLHVRVNGDLMPICV